MNIKTYGRTPDGHDCRDFNFGLLKISQDLPTMVDLRTSCSPIEDQGNLGSCTAQAVIGMLEYLEHKEKASFYDLSRLFLYYNTRKLQGTESSDSGASLRMTLKASAKEGSCAEKSWPYNIKNYTKRPSAECYTDGSTHKVLAYYKLYNLADMMKCLADGCAFVFGINIYDSFESDEVAKTGFVPIPGKSETNLGGHAMLCVGYNTNTNMFIVRNSWGSKWGDKGYCYIPFELMTDENFASDFWTVKVGVVPADTEISKLKCPACKEILYSVEKATACVEYEDVTISNDGIEVCSAPYNDAYGHSVYKCPGCRHEESKFEAYIIAVPKSV